MDDAIDEITPHALRGRLPPVPSTQLGGMHDLLTSGQTGAAAKSTARRTRTASASRRHSYRCNKSFFATQRSTRQVPMGSWEPFPA
jgi:hypothetical protein